MSYWYSDQPVMGKKKSYENGLIFDTRKFKTDEVKLVRLSGASPVSMGTLVS